MYNVHAIDKFGNNLCKHLLCIDLIWSTNELVRSISADLNGDRDHKTKKLG